MPQKSSSPAALLAQQGPRRVAMTMLRAWIGEHPADPALKQGLLGL